MTALGLACLLFASSPQSPVLAWNALARDLARSGEAHSFETYALLSLAGWRAWERAEAAAPGHQSAPDVAAHQALAAASAAVLRARHPDAAARIAALSRSQGTDPSWATDLGEATAKEVLALARHGNPREPNPQPGSWVSAKGKKPVGKDIGDIDPWLLEGPTALRPAPPPAPGTPDFKAAIAETRAMSDAATPEQISTARYWAGTDSGNQTPALWNEIAAAELAGETDASAVRVLALMNTAMHEAAIGCFEAKYWFNYPRPSQVDSGIKPRVSLPNFPAYPSAHGCFSGAASAVLAAALPQRSEAMQAKADEAALCRVWSGLHYRFDGDAGLKLGQAAAARVLAAPDKLLGR